MRYRLLLTAILICLPVIMFAQRIVTVSGEYTHYAPMNVTPEQAEITAIERAKIDLIEKEFGRVVGVNNYTKVINEGEESSVEFLSLGESEVKGEWIETIGKPTIKHEFANNLQVITVSITGRIREIITAKVGFDAKILRNGFTDKYESSQFKADVDNYYISFKAPTDGYVVVYQYDLSGVYRLLPLKRSDKSTFPVKAGKHYIFLASDMDGDGVSFYEEIKDKNQEAVKSIYSLTCNGDSEVNRLYIIFSPNKFTKANDTETDDSTTPAFIDFEGFQKWFSRCKKKDKELSWVIRDIVISK